MSDSSFMHKGFQDDPDAYEWRCDVCGKMFRPKVMWLADGKARHTPRCSDCAANVLIESLFGKGKLPEK